MIHLDEKIGKDGLERAVLVGIFNRNLPKEKAEEYLDELELLTKTAGAVTLKTYLQRLDRPIPGTYIGTGKLEEIKNFIEENPADLLVFDDDLSPSQVRNIDKLLNVKVLDRSGIILHIFSERARTAQAKAQVELAQLQYMLPRLTGLWTHLSKQKGGIGLKGAGEKEIETDRRMIRFKIDLLRKELKKIDRQNATRRKGRDNMVRVSLVGYTNAGKSTLMNQLSKSKKSVLAEDKLFATLDTTSRRFRFPEEKEIVITDTVGFIEDLPKTLIEAFKATLEELEEADLLLHVLDASDPYVHAHMASVNAILEQLGLEDRPVLLVWNKSDAADPAVLTELVETHGGMPTSATSGDGCEGLLDWVEQRLFHEAQRARTLADLSS